MILNVVLNLLSYLGKQMHVMQDYLRIEQHDRSQLGRLAIQLF